MLHPDHAGAPPAASDAAVLVGAAYAVPCRECGTRLSVTEDELAASLDLAPVCWPCAQGGVGDVPATG